MGGEFEDAEFFSLARAEVGYSNSVLLGPSHGGHKTTLCRCRFCRYVDCTTAKPEHSLESKPSVGHDTRKPHILNCKPTVTLRLQGILCHD